MSKGLELLKRHKKSMEDLLDNGTILPELYFVFKDELNIIEQELKALEILKKTGFDDVILEFLIRYDYSHNTNYHNVFKEVLL